MIELDKIYNDDGLARMVVMNSDRSFSVLTETKN